MLNHPIARLGVAAALAVAPAVTATASTSVGGATSFKNCTAIRKVYSGGIAKRGVTFNTTHSHGKTYHRPLKGTVKFDDDLYAANRKSDADKDRIACEQG